MCRIPTPSLRVIQCAPTWPLMLAFQHAMSSRRTPHALTAHACASTCRADATCLIPSPLVRVVQRAVCCRHVLLYPLHRTCMRSNMPCADATCLIPPPLMCEIRCAVGWCHAPHTPPLVSTCRVLMPCASLWLRTHTPCCVPPCSFAHAHWNVRRRSEGCERGRGHCCRRRLRLYSHTRLA